MSFRLNLFLSLPSAFHSPFAFTRIVKYLWMTFSVSLYVLHYVESEQHHLFTYTTEDTEYLLHNEHCHPPSHIVIFHSNENCLWEEECFYWTAATRKSGQQRSRFHSKCLFSVSVIARGLHIVLNAFRARSHTNFYFFSCQFIINIEFPMLHFFQLDFEMRVNEFFFLSFSAEINNNPLSF